ncbi:amidohydrolase family protein [Aquincola sp. J276]|uniref:amidohydrolase family protein n=1 Tax=Aquincola sp. J276 TaxID=2898432 RepID=UPI002150FE64|nr:amidohydrolase family protein [Aquincola sp. J276]MCR5868314.1 amidohydrolase family protein [Aquincola sp. J276]
MQAPEHAPLREALDGPRLLLAPELAWLDDEAVSGQGIVIDGGRFTDIGPLDEVQARHPGLPALALPGRLLMPGFIDTHHHLTQSFGKSLAFGEPSEIFRRIWVPLEQHLDGRALYLSAKLAALEALRGGFTTVADAGTRSREGLQAIATAVHEAGLRCVLARVCNDAGSDEAQRRGTLHEAEAHLARWAGDALVHGSLAVSVPEAATDGTMGRAAALCREAGAVLQVHANEHLASVERSLVERGLRPLGHMRRAGALGPNTLVAHATLVTPDELLLLRDTGTAVAYNPVASAWKGNAVAPALMMQALGIPLGLGTDGTRSDAFRLMDAAETAQRLAFGLATGDSSCGAGWTWLRMATAGGAQACGLGGHTGRIAIGLAADCLLLDTQVPELMPSWDLGWELVRLAHRGQIEAVLVAGRLRLWQGWPTDWDARALMAEVQAVARQAVAAAPIQRVHAVSAEHRQQAGG